MNEEVLYGIAVTRFKEAVRSKMRCQKCKCRLSAGGIWAAWRKRRGQDNADADDMWRFETDFGQCQVKWKDDGTIR